MKKKYLILIFMISIFTFTGCEQKKISKVEATTDVAQTYLEEKKYSSLNELLSANSKAKSAGEPIYYINTTSFNEDLALTQINENEGIFWCEYSFPDEDEPIVLTTDRNTDGKHVLETLVHNNPETFIPTTIGSIDFYYIEEDGVFYYYWISDGYLLQINMSEQHKDSLLDFIENIEFKMVYR